MSGEIPLEFQFTCQAAPVQAEGTVAGRPFYFRARGAWWSFSVSERPDVDPVEIDSAEAAAGRGWWRGGDYGPSGRYAASYMPLEEARQLIRQCAADYVRETRAGRG